MKRRILLIEPNKENAEKVKQELTLYDLIVHVKDLNDSTLEEMGIYQPDLVLIDISIGDTDGYRICRNIKQHLKFKNTPVVFFSYTNTRVEDVITGLECGADDYLRGPISFRELSARIRAILRRVEYRGEIDEVIKIGTLELNINEHTVTLSDRKQKRRINLTPKEFDLLHLLMKKAGRVVNRETILQVVWGYAPDLDTKTLDVYVHRLRTKLGKETGKVIETVLGLGYKFARE